MRRGDTKQRPSNVFTDMGHWGFPDEPASALAYLEAVFYYDRFQSPGEERLFAARILEQIGETYLARVLRARRALEADERQFTAQRLKKLREDATALAAISPAPPKAETAKRVAVDYLVTKELAGKRQAKRARGEVAQAHRLKDLVVSKYAKEWRTGAERFIEYRVQWWRGKRDRAAILQDLQHEMRQR